MNARLEYRIVQAAIRGGMTTVGELLSYLQGGVIKNPKRHCIKKYRFKLLKG